MLSDCLPLVVNCVPPVELTNVLLTTTRSAGHTVATPAVCTRSPRLSRLFLAKILSTSESAWCMRHGRYPNKSISTTLLRGWKDKSGRSTRSSTRLHPRNTLALVPKHTARRTFLSITPPRRSSRPLMHSRLVVRKMTYIHRS